jgi:ribosomal protein L11 methyltransferase
MAWLAIKLNAGADAAESLADALLEAGALSVSCDDADAGTAAESAQYAEPGLLPPQPWRENIMTALVPADANAQEIVAAAAAICAMPTPSFCVYRVEDEDWVRATQRQFEPMNVATGVWVVPSWCNPPDPRAINISIDPGLAFGTGSHATTRLMLRWIAKILAGGEIVLDYGCGSGILAIAAARLGAREAIGIDIDPQAILAAEENARKNQVATRFFLPGADPDVAVDIVVANILAVPLIVLAPLIIGKGADRIALSGILESQADDVIAAYASAYRLEIADGEEGWVLIAGQSK